MESVPLLYTRDIDELNRALQLIPRDGGKCVECNGNTRLHCPDCPKGHFCTFSVPTDCTQCAKSICVKDDSSNNSPPPSNDDGGGSGPNVGAIAGGVIGGLLVIALISYLVWRFLVKPKRGQADSSVYEVEGMGMPSGGVEKDNASRLTRRSSTHTVHSIASTVLTRASNIIQIAYIPGVTNRATPTSPTVLVPPVPPIPMHHSEGNRESAQEDQHFFMPGDLRDSTYSGISGYSDRTSYARTSYAPRSSIASTIYGKQAQVFTSTQTLRAKPTMVSVRSAGGNSPGSTPPVPSIDFDKFQNNRPKSGASAFSVGSTFLNNANTATQARAQVVKVGGGLKKIDVSNKNSAASSQHSQASSPDSPQAGPTTRDSNAVTVIEDSPAVDQGPFSDPPEGVSPMKSISTPTLGVVMEDGPAEDDEADRVTVPLMSKERGTSPFGDEHATRE